MLEMVEPEQVQAGLSGPSLSTRPLGYASSLLKSLFFGPHIMVLTL